MSDNNSRSRELHNIVVANFVSDIFCAVLLTQFAATDFKQFITNICSRELCERQFHFAVLLTQFAATVVANYMSDSNSRSRAP